MAGNKKINMTALIKTVAKIHLFTGTGMRKNPFKSGYRPLFDFSQAKTKISGQINLINSESFEPGKSGVVEITFIRGIISDRYFKVGEVFSFGEGTHALGKGQIIQIIA